MDAVAENLKAEARVHSEEQLICFKQILNPLQVSTLSPKVWALAFH